jgi:hypothetical protein
MEQPTVSKAALRSALTRLAEATCGTAPASVRVALMTAGQERTYAALVPFEYRAEVHHHIAEHTDVCVPADGGALILTDDQALKIINLAYSWQQGSPLHVSA